MPVEECREMSTSPGDVVGKVNGAVADALADPKVRI
jgi:hypothetical protein